MAVAESVTVMSLPPLVTWSSAQSMISNHGLRCVSGCVKGSSAQCYRGKVSLGLVKTASIGVTTES